MDSIWQWNVPYNIYLFFFSPNVEFYLVYEIRITESPYKKALKFDIFCFIYFILLCCHSCRRSAMDSIYHEIFKKWKLSNPYFVHRYFVKWYRWCFFLPLYFLFLLYIYMIAKFLLYRIKNGHKKKNINESKFAKREIIWHKWKESWFLISDLCESTKHILVASVFCFLYFFFHFVVQRRLYCFILMLMDQNTQSEGMRCF